MPDPRPPLSPEVLAALATPRSYPHDPSAGAGVQWVQTHISHVFLTGTRVYKFRKHVDLGFVRFDADQSLIYETRIDVGGRPAGGARGRGSRRPAA